MVLWTCLCETLFARYSTGGRKDALSIPRLCHPTLSWSSPVTHRNTLIVLERLPWLWSSSHVLLFFDLIFWLGHDVVCEFLFGLNLIVNPFIPDSCALSFPRSGRFSGLILKYIFGTSVLLLGEICYKICKSLVYSFVFFFCLFLLDNLKCPTLNIVHYILLL